MSSSSSSPTSISDYKKKASLGSVRQQSVNTTSVSVDLLIVILTLIAIYLQSERALNGTIIPEVQEHITVNMHPVLYLLPHTPEPHTVKHLVKHVVGLRHNWKNVIRYFSHSSFLLQLNFRYNYTSQAL